MLLAASWVASGSLPAPRETMQFVEWAARMMRTAASPATAQAFMRMQGFMDAREVLPLIRVPTLVLDRSEAHMPKGPVDMPPLEESQYVAERIPGAELVALPGRDYLPWVGDRTASSRRWRSSSLVSAPVRAAGPRPAHGVVHRHCRLDAALQPSSGTHGWRELLERHNALVRGHSTSIRGREVDRAGDGFLATFDGPARAIRCAQAIVASAGVRGSRSGPASTPVRSSSSSKASAASRCTLALGWQPRREPGEVLVTSTVNDLVAGSGLEFGERGEHALKGVPGSWRLFAAAAA